MSMAHHSLHRRRRREGVVPSLHPQRTGGEWGCDFVTPLRVFNRRKGAVVTVFILRG